MDRGIKDEVYGKIGEEGSRHRKEEKRFGRNGGVGCEREPSRALMKSAGLKQRSDSI